MGRKKEQEEQIENKNNIELVSEQIIKEYGEGVFVDGSAITNEKTEIINWCPSLDMITMGVPKGSWVSISGKFKTGKTTAALTLASKAQKAGMDVFFGSVEGRLKKMNLQGIKDLIIERPRFNIIQSTKDRILSAQDFLRIFENILKTYPNCLLIIDSVSALADEIELSSGVGKETRAHHNKVISQFVNNTANVVTVMKSIVIGITHIIANTSGIGNPTVEKAANRWLYQADVRIKAQKSLPWRVGGTTGKQIGQIVTWKCECSALGPPGGIQDGYLRYGVGFDEASEIIEFAKIIKLIKPNGSWIKLSFLDNEQQLLVGTELEGKQEPQLQGTENVYQFINKYPKILEKLQEKIQPFLGDLVGCASNDD